MEEKKIMECNYLGREVSHDECIAAQKAREDKYRNDDMYGDPFYEVFFRAPCEKCPWLDISF